MRDDGLADFVQDRLQEDLARHAAANAFQQTLVDIYRTLIAADPGPRVPSTYPGLAELRTQQEMIGALLWAQAGQWNTHPAFKPKWGDHDG